MIVLILTCALYGALVGPHLLNQQTQMVAIGEVAPQEILAPYSVTFESRVFTDIEREKAAAGVPSVFLPPDPNIARSQLEKLENALYFISTVRSDIYASESQKVQDLKALDDLQMSDIDYLSLLELEEADWMAIRGEASRVLEVVLRESIRNNQLGSVRNNLPAIIDFSFKSDQTKLIIALTSSYIVPTSLFSEEQTELSRDQARSAVVPITRQIIAGEVIVRRGEVVTAADLEALNTYGLGEPSDQTSLLISSLAIISVTAILVLIFYQRNRKQVFSQLNSLALVAFSFPALPCTCEIFVMDHTVLPISSRWQLLV